MSTFGTLARRTFLMGAAALAGGAAFGVYVATKPLRNPLEDAESTALTPYVLIDANGVTLIAPRAEMGQGVHTTLAALVAEELDVDLAEVSVLHGPAAQAYFNGALLGLSLPFADYALSDRQEWLKEKTAVLPKMLSLQVTGGSTSMIDGYEKMRAAGAAARQALVSAAAARYSVDAAELRTEAGAVVMPDGARVPYSDLAVEAASHVPATPPDLRPASDWRLLGRSQPRVDLLAKSTGTASFGIDTRLPGLRFATVRMCPHFGGTMDSFDTGGADTMPGVEQILDLGDGIAVVASNTWLAIQAAEAIDIVWTPSPLPASHDAMLERIEAALDGPENSVLREDGDLERGLSAGATLEASYEVPFLAHATMEPMNATALYSGDHLEVWSGNQAPVVHRDKAAEAVDLRPDQVTLHTPLMGGGFGRRGEYDATVLAARVARAVPGTPVQVTWSREEDMTHDYYRPAARARFRGAVADGTATALEARVAAPSVTRQSVRRLSGFSPPGPDKGMVEGLFDQPYAIPAFRVAGHIADLDVPIGFWRSVGASHNGFFLESFIDEMAHAAARDPLDFRRELIAPAHMPSAQVLDAVAEMSGWSAGTSPGVGRGVAFCHSFGTPVAEVVEVRDEDGAIRIHEAWIACDPGLALDPAILEAQMRSGLIFGLSAAVLGEVTFTDGAADQRNFPDYDALRLGSAPSVSVRILENNPGLGGAGEPGTPPSMPALANAVFDLTGVRPRRLPLIKDFDFVV